MPKSIHVDVRRDRDEREETLGVARSRDKNRETVDIIRPSGRREYETRYYDEDTEDYYARKKALIKRQQSWPHKRDEYEYREPRVRTAEEVLYRRRGDNQGYYRDPKWRDEVVIRRHGHDDWDKDPKARGGEKEIIHRRLEYDGEDLNHRRPRSADRTGPVHPFKVYREAKEAAQSMEEPPLVASNRDVSLHFELDVGPDLEPAVEAFGALCRRGDFRSAREHFRENLEEHIDEPAVFVPYAQMLLDMGSYGELSKLNPGFNELNDDEESLEVELLGTMWETMRACCYLHTGLMSRDATGSYSGLEYVAVPGQAVRIDCLLNYFCTHIKRYTNRTPILRWDNKISKDLCAKGQIWNWRDYLISSCTRYRRRNADVSSPLDSDPAKTCDQLFQQWGTTSFDLSTGLALLDILTSLAIKDPLTNPRNLATATHFVNKAQDIVASIAEHDPSALESRQYVLWLLAKIAVTTYRQRDPWTAMPGLRLEDEDALDLPIYIPCFKESPVHNSTYAETDGGDKIQLALRAAYKLGDFRTHVQCLKQLALRSAKPGKIFEDLFKLQYNTQQDVHGSLRTLLAKYVICADATSGERLREDILTLGECTGLTPSMRWARLMVLRALSTRDQEANALLDEASSLKEAVTPDISSFMDRISKLPDDDHGDGTRPAVHDQSHGSAAPARDPSKIQTILSSDNSEGSSATDTSQSDSRPSTASGGRREERWALTRNPPQTRDFINVRERSRDNPSNLEIRRKSEVNEKAEHRDRQPRVTSESSESLEQDVDGADPNNAASAPSHDKALTRREYFDELKNGL